MARKIEKLRDRAKEELIAAAKERDETQRLNRLIAHAPSTKELQKAILSLFADKDFNPVAEMIDMVQGKDGELEIKDKITLCKALAEFFPKPKTMEITGSVDTTTTFIIQQFNSPKKLENVQVELEEGKTIQLNQDPNKGPVFSKEDYAGI